MSEVLHGRSGGGEGGEGSLAGFLHHGVFRRHCALAGGIALETGASALSRETNKGFWGLGRGGLVHRRVIITVASPAVGQQGADTIADVAQFAGEYFEASVCQ